MARLESAEFVQFLRAGSGPDAMEFRTSAGPAWVVRSASAIPPDLRAFAFESHSKDFRYYEVIEESLSDQFDFRYFVLRDDVSDGWAIQPFFVLDQDLLAGVPRGFRKVAGWIRKLWPRFLKLKMMMIGCATAEGQLDHAQPWVVSALRQAVDFHRQYAKASIILFKDFPSHYRERMDSLSRHGYKRIASLPAAKLDLDFDSFESYMMDRLSKVFRKSLRRKFRAGEDAPPLEMEVVEDVSEIAGEIYKLHIQTFERSDLQFEKLNPEYFSLIAERMPDRVRYFIWRQNGRMVAFNLCVVHEGTLYDLDIGLDYSVALDLHLYFITWRDVITWCLRNGIRTYHAGPLSYDPKAHLRFTLAPQDLYARHNSALLNPFFKLAIEYLGPTRHMAILQEFHNAHEI